MPTLTVCTNVPAMAVGRRVSVAAPPAAGPGSTEEFVLAASKAVASSVGKPEQYVMVTLQAGIPMAFAGSTDPAAFCTLSSIGAIGGDKNKKISAAICEVLEEYLGVPRDRTYIRFHDCAAADWGFDGSTFA